jgi:hypothetical protein
LNCSIVGDCNGIYQFIDPFCIDQSDFLHFTARMKVVSKLNGEGISCAPDSETVLNGCPPVRVAGYKADKKVFDEPALFHEQPTYLVNRFFQLL